MSKLCSCCELKDGNKYVVQGKIIIRCESCFKKFYNLCLDCNEYELKARGYFVDHDQRVFVCRECYYDYIHCELCNNCIHLDSANFPIEDLDHCVHCLSKEGKIDNFNIFETGWGYDTDIKFGKPSDQLYTGVELEVESVTNGRTYYDANHIAKIMDKFVVFKRDCSLRDDGMGGFEIVTYPSDLANHYLYWDKFFKDIPQGLRSWQTEKRCGMHVHISRKPLENNRVEIKCGEYTTHKSPWVERIVHFVNTNENRQLVNKIAGRRESGYCRKFHKPTKRVYEDLKSPYNFGEKYNAVNKSSRNTLEFRIFKGTLNRNSFYKNIEFVYATVRFCKFTSALNLNTPTFIDYVNSRKENYPFLHNWLLNHNFVEQQRVTSCA